VCAIWSSIIMASVTMVSLTKREQDMSIPARDSFCEARDITNVASLIAKGSPVLFHTCDVHDHDAWQRHTMAADMTIYGCLTSGEKARVHLTTDQGRYFDYDVSREPECSDLRLTQQQLIDDPEEVQHLQNKGIEKMRAILSVREIKYKRIEPVWLRQFQSFSLQKHLYMRIIFDSSYTRDNTIRSLIRDPEFSQRVDCLGHDGVGFLPNTSYYNATAREQKFAAAGWNVMRNYSHNMITNAVGDKYHEFYVSVRDFSAWRDSDSTSTGPGTSDRDTYLRDHTHLVVESWDIETHNKVKDGLVPSTGYDCDIVTISLVYSWIWNSAPIVCYVLSLYPSSRDTMKIPQNSHCLPPIIDTAAKRVDAHFIYCQTERELIRMRALISARMMPDIRVAFNGSNFDTPIMRDKVNEILHSDERQGIEVIRMLDMSTHGVDDKGVKSTWDRMCFTHMNMKISAENKHDLACIALLPGALDIDAQAVLHKRFAREEVFFAGSLNRYLQLSGLPSKIDIPYKLMDLIFTRAKILADPRVPRVCHCAMRAGPNACPLCRCASSSGVAVKWHVRELDYAPADESVSMSERTYRDGLDGSPAVLRDPRLSKCCACCARELNMADIALVNEYCAIDSVRPIQLLCKLDIFQTMLELSNITYTSLYDSVYHADGMRVVNFLASFAHDMEIAIPEHVNSRAHSFYQGAHVFKPILGRYTRPVTALDFSSLYPSIMMAYNISPETLVTSAEFARDLESRGYELHRIDAFEYEEGEKKGAPGNTVRKHSGGWSVRHGGVIRPWTRSISSAAIPTTVRYSADDSEIVGRPALDCEHMGLVGLALNVALDGRKKVRRMMATEIESAILAQLKSVVGELPRDFELTVDTVERQMDTLFAHKDASASALADVRRNVADLKLRYNCMNAKQLALKVLANTFYGQMGSQLSPCYSLLGAYGVTEAGRYNIKRVADHLRKMGYTIVYGDTDSVYTCAPLTIYAQVDAEWSARREELARAGIVDVAHPTYVEALREYWGKQIVLAREDMERLRIQVSAFLREDNGTRFLNMAYEEVGMPSLFFGKKKYLLRPHVKGVTFGKKPMIRGLDMIKQGKSNVLRDIGNTLIERLLDIREEIDICGTVERELRAFYTGEHQLKDFIQYVTYRATKNVMVSTYVTRMTERYEAVLREKGPAEAAKFDPPKLNDKFAYVVVTRDAVVDACGHSITYKVGDKMEPPYMVESGQATLDLDYYVEGPILMMLARLASCDVKFDGEGIEHPDPDVKYKKYDEWRVSCAKKYLLTICAEHKTGSRVNKNVLGRKIRSTIGAMRDVIADAVKDGHGIYISSQVMNVLINNDIGDICASHSAGNGEEATARMTELICEIAVTSSATTAIQEIAKYVEAIGLCNTPQDLAKMYAKCAFGNKIRSIDAIRASVRERVTQIAPSIIVFWLKHRIGNLISSVSREAAETSTLTRKPVFVKKIKQSLFINDEDVRLLRDLDAIMLKYKDVDMMARKEAAARAEYAKDCSD